MHELADQLKGDEMEEAVSFANQVDDFDIKRRLIYILYQRWGEVDGVTASQSDFGEDRELVSAAHRALAKGWAVSDPKATFSWYQQLKGGKLDQKIKDEVLKDTLTVWLTSEPEAAVTAFNALSYDEQKVAERSFKRHGDDPKQIQKVATAVEAISDPRMRLEMIEDVGELWARMDSAAAMAWFDSLQIQNGVECFRGCFRDCRTAARNRSCCGLCLVISQSPRGAQRRNEGGDD